MSDEPTGTSAAEGTTGAPPAPAAEPAGQPDGVAEASSTTTAASGSGSDDTFFDPKDIQDKPELVSAYKQMQRAFTKKMQSLSEHRSKAEAYDAFNRDPINAMQAMAQRLGYKLTRAEAAQQLAQQQDNAPWEPKSWDDVLNRAKSEAKQELMRELSPVFSEVTQIKRQSIEKQLTDIDPTWHEYEDRMKENLAAHPSLARDPATLYRISVPQEVLESRAVQKALKKMEDKVKSSSVAGGSTTTKKPPAGMPEKPITFAEAVEIAKARLAQEGVRP